MNAFYDLTAHVYDPLLFLALRPMRKTVAEELEEWKNGKVADLCCGTGDQLRYLGKQGFSDLHGVDLSPSMLEVAKRKGGNIELRLRDATDTGYPDGSFDAVIISLALHEKEPETQRALVREARRILKRDGTLLIADFVFDGKTSPLAKVGIRLVEGMAGGEHYRNFKRYIENGGLPDVMKGVGFSKIGEKRRIMGGLTVSLFRPKAA